MEPAWWIVKRNALVQTPNFDLISTATIGGIPGVLLVEAKAHHGELESCGKSFRGSSNPENHQKIGASCGFHRRRTLIPKGTRTAFRAEGERCSERSDAGLSIVE